MFRPLHKFHNNPRNILNEEMFYRKLEEANRKSRFVVIFCYAYPNPLCGELYPTVQILVDKYPQVMFLLLNVDLFPDLAMLFGFELIPAFIFIKNKVMLGQYVGSCQFALRHTLRECLKRYKKDCPTTPVLF